MRSTLLFLKLAILIFAGTLNSLGQTEKKNLLFIITDQYRYDALSRAGNTVINTPNLDRLSSEGVYFTNAYTPMAVCGPARSSILTGRTVENTGVNSNGKTYYDAPDAMTSLTYDEILTSNGYHAEYYGKWHSNSYHTSIYKNPVQEANNGASVFGPGGQTHIYRDFLSVNEPQFVVGSGQFSDLISRRPYTSNPMDKYHGMSATQLNELGLEHSQPDQHGALEIDSANSFTAYQARQTIAALERLKDSTFTLTCSFHFPHAPMVPTEPYYSMYPPSEMTPPASISDDMLNSPYRSSNGRLSNTQYANPNKIKYMISNYYGLIKEIDDWVGKILDKLDELGLAENTMVIFTSDHGEMLGAHGMREKNVFYEESSHIPLLIRFPNEIQAGSTVDSYVSLTDLFPTILDYLNAEEHPSDGESLRNLIEGNPTTHGDYVVTEWGVSGNNQTNYMIIKDGWKLLLPFDPESPIVNALYDLNTDPHEVNNLLGSNPNAINYLSKAEELKTHLLQWLSKNNSQYFEGVSQRELIPGVENPISNAEFVAQSVPTNLAPGETTEVQVTMKNTGTSTWNQDNLFELGSHKSLIPGSWGINYIELEAAEQIAPGEEKTFIFTITAPQTLGLYNFQWMMQQHQLSGFGEYTSNVSIDVGNVGTYIDDCDNLEGWISDGTIAIDNTQQQQGTGAIQYDGNQSLEYAKVLASPFNYTLGEANAVLQFWYFISDTANISSSTTVELGSEGGSGNNLFKWQIDTIKNGWNLLSLRLSDAIKVGAPDLQVINWFQLYADKTGNLLSSIDAIRIIDNSWSKTKFLEVIDGTGSGFHTPGSEINLEANPPNEGQLFKEWIIVEGNATISNIQEANTTLSMGTTESVVKASYEYIVYKNNAQFIEQNVPAEMEKGVTYQVSVTMRNIGTIPWSAESDHKLGSQNPQGNSNWGQSRVQLNAGEIIEHNQDKKFEFEITAPTLPGLYNFQWRMLQESVEWFGDYTQNVEFEVVDPDAWMYIDQCEVSTGWESDNILVSSQEHKQGYRSIQMTGSNPVEFQKKFDPPYTSAFNPEEAILQFWYYISDASKLGNQNQVELGSGGEADKNEYNWSITGLNTGWNHINLKLSEAGVTGGAPDLSALNWFRIHGDKSARIQTRIDAIQLLDVASGDFTDIILGVNQLPVNSLKIYPNPNLDGKLSVELPELPANKPVNIEIFNTEGKRILHYIKPYQKTLHLEVNKLNSKEVYLIIVKSGDFESTGKFIVN